MRSWQIVRWGAPLEGRERPTPTPQGAEALLRVRACGVCHSDLHIHQGHFDLGDGERVRIEDRGLRLPFTMGHEVAGEVLALGPDAQGVRVGDRRVVYPWIGCGACPECAGGRELMCLAPRHVGTWRDGGYSDTVLVPDARYLVDPEGVPEDLACTYACSGITAWSALKKAGLAREDQRLLLVGLGGLGLQALGMAPSLVPGAVAAADVDPAKREGAAAAGAALVVDNSTPDAIAAVRDWSEGGVAAAVDFVGRPETARFAIDCLRKGGTLVVVGLYGGRLALPLPWLPLRSLTLRGSHVGTVDDLREILSLARSGRLPSIAVDARPLDRANDALTDLAAGRAAGRIVLRP